MIGVIPKPEQRAVVEEFFELFKTPWEFYEQGRTYDVVIAATDDIPTVDARLLLVYGAETKSTDVRDGIKERWRHTGGSLSYEGIDLPVYGDLLTFEEGAGTPCAAAATGIAGVRIASAAGLSVLRIGYDLFQEVQALLSLGQPVDHAHIPTLDIHIRMLRSWILAEGIPLLEIPPAPAGHSFAVCLTHDIDFVGIRNHKFDHTMWGFLYRSTIGALQNFRRHRISVTQLLRIWRAAASLPFVYVGWAKDFWSPFEWYLRVEKNLPATYYLIPFKRRMGEHVPGEHASRRATAYDVSDIHSWTEVLMSEGCELGVHGIDSWHSVEKGRNELERVAEITGESAIGIRMHWLLCDINTPAVLESSGYTYDSTAGYNETVGYRSGTAQVFRPIGAKTLLELPLHIQDGALFYQNRLNLSEIEAEKLCKALIENAGQFGGVLTVLWHDRSHGPERFWGDFYDRLIQVLKSSDAWFATATQTVEWFRKRRSAQFVRINGADATRNFVKCDPAEGLPPLRLRIHYPPNGRREAQPCSAPCSHFVDVPWDGKTIVEFDASLRKVYDSAVLPSVSEVC